MMIRVRYGVRMANSSKQLFNELIEANFVVDGAN